MSAQDFEMVPPGKFASLFPVFIGLVLPMMVFVPMLLATQGKPEIWTIAPFLLVFPVVSGVLAWSMHRRTLQLEEGKLLVRRFPWPRRIATAEMDLEQAAILNLDEHRELQPVFKIAGTRLPGYHSGLFRLRDRRRATVLLTDWQRVLVLPLRKGRVLLLSPQRPDALLAALRRTNG